MSIEGFIASYGVYALGFLTFIAVLGLPLSQEAMFIAGVAAHAPVVEAVIACSAGNCLACLINYTIGMLLRPKVRAKLESNTHGKRVMAWMERRGTWSLLASWLPIVGDPLTYAAGIAAIPLWRFMLLVFPLRTLRYYVLGYGMHFLNAT